MGVAIDHLRRASAPLVPLYAAGVRLRNRAYDAGWLPAHRAPCQVVSIGNLTTGGTGKTPVARAIAEALRERGEQPAILLRGYGAAGELEPAPTWRERPPEHALERWGDEALCHARATPEIPVYAHRDRCATAERAAARGCTVVVLDDGFQHRRLARDVDVVCLDARSPLGRGGLLPRGDLREPVSSLRRASALFWTRWEPDRHTDAKQSVIVAEALAVSPPPSVRWCFAPGLLRRAGTAETTVGAKGPFLCAAGIARPESLAENAALAGLALAGFERFRDHHAYREDEVRRLEESLARLGALALLTTEKDEVRFLSCEAGARLAAAGLLYVLELRCAPVDPIDAVLAANTSRVG